MTELTFDFDWEEPQGARGPELRATWARLRISVDGQPVTRVFHSGLNSVRDSIYVPLYPLAEWVAASWWSLLYEVQPRAGFRERHNFRFGREGFAFPDLRILPLGSTTLLQWEPRWSPDWPVRFLERGTAYVSGSNVERELRRVLNACVERLEGQDVGGTYLQDEWSKIQDLVEEEIEFCRAAAALGLDPFSVSKKQERLLMGVHRQLGERCRLEREFLHAAQLDKLEDQLVALERAEKELALERSGLVDLGSFSFDSSAPPWHQGYEVARALRKRLEDPEARFSQPEDLARALSNGAGAAPIGEVASAELFDAVVRPVPGGGAAFALDKRKQRSESRTFAFCRALGEWLCQDSGSSAELSLVTHSPTENQRRNRAFAAELLAPAELLARELSSDAVGPEELEELAEQFFVSTWVIEHQLENHRLVRERFVLT